MELRITKGRLLLQVSMNFQDVKSVVKYPPSSCFLKLNTTSAISNLFTGSEKVTGTQEQTKSRQLMLNGVSDTDFSDGLHRKMSQGMQQTKWERGNCIPNWSSHPLITSIQYYASEPHEDTLRSTSVRAHRWTVQRSGMATYHCVILLSWYQCYRKTDVVYSQTKKTSKHSVNLHFGDTNISMNELRAAAPGGRTTL